MINLSRLSSVPDPLPDGVKLPREYFVKRGTRFDYPGALNIAWDSYWGYLVLVLCRSHHLEKLGRLGPVELKGVTVESGAWICSGSLLHNCYIGAGSIVAAGSVVRGQTVAPGVMVAGNPARVIARWDGERWAYLPESESGFVRVLE